MKAATAIFPRALLIVFLALAFPIASFAHWDVGVTVGFAPPELPLYSQPPCPADGYIWTPGYWAYSADDEDYYWVPGTWVLAPSPGLLWTPGYWGVIDDDYVWHEGYWAPHVGFYGGINYGFGYFGVGFAGGYWRGRDFYYNRAVANLTDVHVTNVYNSTVINNHFNGGRVSFNGRDGVRARPAPSELIAARESHRGFTAPQRLQAESARSVPGLLASVNHGHPSVAATARPGLLNARTAEPARAAGSAPSMRQRAGNTGRPISPPRLPATNANDRRSEPHSAAISARQPTPYRPAPTAAYHQVPSYTASHAAYTAPHVSYTAPHTPQPMPRNQSYAAPPHPPVAQMPRTDTGPHGPAPGRTSASPMQDRRRS